MTNSLSAAIVTVAPAPAAANKTVAVSAMTRVQVRRIDPFELTAHDRQAWVALEARAVEPNAYLSPHFVLPALRHLDPGLRPIVLAVERASQGAARELIGLGVFVAVAGSRICPLPQLVGYQSRHSFLGGLLVDRDHVGSAVEALYSHARAGVLGWHALVLPKMPGDGPVAAALDQLAAASGLRTWRASPQQRAVLRPGAAGQEALRKALGKRYNEVERCKRRLGEGGEVSWACLRGEVGAAVIEQFLALEHQGWKAEAGTSLRAHAADEMFFKDVVAGFAGAGRALFTELRVGAKVIASTSNFVSGGAGFAFKVGWEAELRKYGPGLLNEVEFVRAAPEVCADLAWLDSGAAPDSFINKLWTERRDLATLVVPLSQLGDFGLRVTGGLRHVVRRLRKPAVQSTDTAADEAKAQQA